MSRILLERNSILGSRNDSRIGGYWPSVLEHFRTCPRIFRCRSDITNDALQDWEDIATFLNTVIRELGGDSVRSECLHVFRCIVSCTSCLENELLVNTAVWTNLVTVSNYKDSLSKGFMHIAEKITQLKTSIDPDSMEKNVNKDKASKQKVAKSSSGKDGETKLEYLLVYLDTLLSSLRWSLVTDVLSTTDLNFILLTIQDCVSYLDEQVQSVKLNAYKGRIHQLCVACFARWLSNHELYETQCDYFFDNIQFWGTLFMEQVFQFFDSLGRSSDIEDVMTNSDSVKDILDIFHNLHQISLSSKSLTTTGAAGVDVVSQLKTIMMERVAKSENIVTTVDSNSNHDSQLIKNNDYIAELFEIIEAALNQVAENGKSGGSVESAMCLCARWWQIIVGVLSYQNIDSFLIDRTNNKSEPRIRVGNYKSFTKPLSSIFKLIQDNNNNNWSKWPYVFSAWIFTLSLYQDMLEKHCTAAAATTAATTVVKVDPSLVKMIFKILQPIVANVSMEDASIEVIGGIDNDSLLLASKCLELIFQMSWPDIKSVLGMEATGSSRCKVRGKSGKPETVTVIHLLDSYLSVDHLPANSNGKDVDEKEDSFDYNRDIMKSCIASRLIASLCYGAHSTLIKSQDHKSASAGPAKTGWNLFCDEDCLGDYKHMSIRPYQTIFVRGLFCQGKTSEALIDQAQLSYTKHKDDFSSMLTFAKKCFVKMGLLLKCKEQNLLRRHIVATVMGLTRSWQMLINAVGRSLLRDFIASSCGGKSEIQSTQALSQGPFQSQSVILVYKEKGKGKEGWKDEDEVAEYVVARDDPSVAAAMDQISQVFVPAFKVFWAQTCCAAYEDFRPMREMFLESMWWIMHRLTAYVFKVDHDLGLHGLCDEQIITLLGTSISYHEGDFNFFWCVLLPTLHHCKGNGGGGGGALSRDAADSSSSSTSESMLRTRNILRAIYRMRKGISEAKDLDTEGASRSFAYLDLRVFISDFLANAIEESAFKKYINSKGNTSNSRNSNGALTANEKRHTHVLLQDEVAWDTKDGNLMILSQLWKGMVWACNELETPWAGEGANLTDLETIGAGLRSLLLTPFYLSNFGQGGFSWWLDELILDEYKRLVKVWLTCEIGLVAPRVENGSSSTPLSELTQLSQIASPIQTMICGGMKCSPHDAANSVRQSRKDLIVLIKVLDVIADNFHLLISSKFWEEIREEEGDGEKEENGEVILAMEGGSGDMMSEKVSDLKYFLRSNMMCCVLSWSNNVRDALSDLCYLESMDTDALTATTDLTFPVIQAFVSTLSATHWITVFNEHCFDKQIDVERNGDNGAEKVASENVTVYVDSICGNDAGRHNSNSLHMDVASNKTPPIGAASSTKTAVAIQDPYSVLRRGDCKYVIMTSILDALEDALSKCQEQVGLQRSQKLTISISSYKLTYYRVFDTVLCLINQLSSLQKIWSTEDLWERVAKLAQSVFIMEGDETALLHGFPRKNELLTAIQPFKDSSSREMGNKKRDCSYLWNTPSNSTRDSSEAVGGHDGSENATKARRFNGVEGDKVGEREEHDGSENATKARNIEADIVGQKDSSDTTAVNVTAVSNGDAIMNVAVNDSDEVEDNEFSQHTAVDSDVDDLFDYNLVKL